MKEHRLKYKIKVLSRLLRVSRSGYYARENRVLSRREIENARLEIAIFAEHHKNKETYGPIRLQRELKDRGFEAGISRIIRLRKKLGIRCRQKRKYKATTDSNHGEPVFDNLLSQNFHACEPNRIWISDITYIWTDEGWLYQSAIADVFHSEVVGYAFSDRLKKELVIRALDQAVENKRPASDLIHHSDRGSQYCSKDYRKRLLDCGMIGSMSRKGNCYDNAMMESFWGILKAECIYGRRFRTRAEAIRVISEFIELFYNRQRRHSRLGYISPAAFLQQYYRNAA